MPSKKKTANSAPAKKAARKQAAKKSSAKKSTVAKKTLAKKMDATGLIKREAHTPTIFKTGAKKGAQVLFSIEDVRRILKQRTAEDKNVPDFQKDGGASKKATGTSSVAVEKADVPQPSEKTRHTPASFDDILGLGAPVSPKTKVAKSFVSPRDVPDEFKWFHDLLISLRNEVRDELNMHSSDTLKRSQKEDSGESATSVDAGSDNFDRDFALSLLSSEQEALKEIEEAIQRIYKGTYGICEVTGKPIARERLEAVPFTRFSVEGQRQYESSARKRVQRTGAFLNEGSGENITFGDDDAES